MRQYYENVGSKKQPRLRNQQSTSSNELEDRDSGFQVIVMSLCPFMSSWCLYVCPSSLLHCALRPLSFICLCVACVSNRLSVCLSLFPIPSLYGVLESGNETNLGESGNETNLGESGTETNLGESGNEANLGESGTETNLGESGNETNPGESGNETNLGKSGNETNKQICYMM